MATMDRERESLKIVEREVVGNIESYANGFNLFVTGPKGKKEKIFCHVARTIDIEDKRIKEIFRRRSVRVKLVSDEYSGGCPNRIVEISEAPPQVKRKRTFWLF